MELNLYLKFLKSPFLEKKLKGINEIKDFSERIEKGLELRYFQLIIIHAMDFGK